MWEAGLVLAVGHCPTDERFAGGFKILDAATKARGQPKDGLQVWMRREQV